MCFRHSPRQMHRGIKCLDAHDTASQMFWCLCPLASVVTTVFCVSGIRRGKHDICVAKFRRDIAMSMFASDACQKKSAAQWLVLNIRACEDTASVTLQSVPLDEPERSVTFIDFHTRDVQLSSTTLAVPIAFWNKGQTSSRPIGDTLLIGYDHVDIGSPTDDGFSYLVYWRSSVLCLGLAEHRNSDAPYIRGTATDMIDIRCNWGVSLSVFGICRDEDNMCAHNIRCNRETRVRNLRSNDSRFIFNMPCVRYDQGANGWEIRHDDSTVRVFDIHRDKHVGASVFIVRYKHEHRVSKLWYGKLIGEFEQGVESLNAHTRDSSENLLCSTSHGVPCWLKIHCLSISSGYLW